MMGNPFISIPALDSAFSLWLRKRLPVSNSASLVVPTRNTAFSGKLQLL
jgi:hypothetical protein